MAQARSSMLLKWDWCFNDFKSSAFTRQMSASPTGTDWGLGLLGEHLQLNTAAPEQKQVKLSLLAVFSFSSHYELNFKKAAVKTKNILNLASVLLRKSGAHKRLWHGMKHLQWEPLAAAQDSCRDAAASSAKQECCNTQPLLSAEGLSCWFPSSVEKTCSQKWRLRAVLLLGPACGVR